MQRLLQLYSRRIVNVNVNVIAAGILALGPMVLVVHLSRHFGVEDDDRFLITAITFIADVCSDVLIYFGLHWLANHRPGVRRISQVDAAYREMSFIRDATTVQIQRIVLSPLLYGVAFGTLYGLLHAGWARELASAVGIVAGIIATRILHTAWMLKLERAALQKLRLIKPKPGEEPASSEATAIDGSALDASGTTGSSASPVTDVHHNSVVHAPPEQHSAGEASSRSDGVNVRNARPATRP